MGFGSTYGYGDRLRRLVGSRAAERTTENGNGGTKKVRETMTTTTEDRRRRRRYRRQPAPATGAAPCSLVRLQPRNAARSTCPYKALCGRTGCLRFALPKRALCAAAVHTRSAQQPNTAETRRAETEQIRRLDCIDGAPYGQYRYFTIIYRMV